MSENGFVVRRLDVVYLSFLPCLGKEHSLAADFGALSMFFRDSAQYHMLDPQARENRMDALRKWLKIFFEEFFTQTAACIVCIIPHYWSSDSRRLLREVIATSGRFGDAVLVTDIAAGAAVLDFLEVNDSATCVSAHDTGVMQIRYTRDSIAWKIVSVNFNRKYVQGLDDGVVIAHRGKKDDFKVMHDIDILDLPLLADALSRNSNKPVRLKYETEIVLGLPGIGELIWPVAGPYPAFHAERIAVKKAPSMFSFSVSARYCKNQQYSAWICNPQIEKKQLTRIIDEKMNFHFDIGLQLHDGICARLFTEMIEPEKKDTEKTTSGVINIEIPHPVD